ncbi:acyl carrier protein [Achromobacter aegrifaciens]|uniref:acyl carrier protein n=1 Tax=Achromobacter aegrifaciens TaxID=1287736 RepID=UPI001466E94D|nr:phosphopantetheine-binding protein [Achromobacter aegrifaciens]CAB3664915.1 Acyl carrier protein [Achromobacter aegrifaciens]
MKVTHDDIIAAIRQAEVVESPEKLRTNMKLTDQGIDSLDMFSVMLAVQEKYGIEISDDDADRLTSIEEITEYLNACLG